GGGAAMSIRHSQWGQVSPWRDPGQSVVLTFERDDHLPIVRVLVTCENPNLSAWARDREYWYHASDSSPPGPTDTLLMRYEHAAWNDDQVRELLSGYEVSFQASQQQDNWSSQIYSPPEGTLTRAFTAPDPDDSTQSIGLALMYGDGELITTIVWQ